MYSAWSWAAEIGDLSEVEEDEVPDPPDEATSRPGDLWVLGRHRLLCGDSSTWEDVERLLGGAPVHLLNTWSGVPGRRPRPEASTGADSGPHFGPVVFRRRRGVRLLPSGGLRRFTPLRRPKPTC